MFKKAEIDIYDLDLDDIIVTSGEGDLWEDEEGDILFPMP